MADKLILETIKGAEIARHLLVLADLRIRVFREWPYLYEGSPAYEREYLEGYALCPDSVVILARDGENIVGASTALPLASADEGFQAAFSGSDYPAEGVFYFGESVLLPAYRGQGTGHHFFSLREQQAAALGAKWAAFCAVERAPGDPRKPSQYRPLDGFWGRLGYHRNPAIKARFDWREIGSDESQPHTLAFWIKDLQQVGDTNTAPNPA